MTANAELRDYYCAATVRLAGASSRIQYALWTRCIKAEDYPAARRAAETALETLGLEWGALDILTGDHSVLVIR